MLFHAYNVISSDKSDYRYVFVAKKGIINQPYTIPQLPCMRPLHFFDCLQQSQPNTLAGVNHL